jgi:hypothetical protein
MPKKFPTDEFDFVEPHGGRHRARRTKRDRAKELLRVTVVAAVVAGLAFFTLRVIDNGVKFDSGSTPTMSAFADPLKTTGVTVLDSTQADGLASKVAHKLLNAGWNVLTADNLSDGASHKSTIVYVSASTFKPAATSLLRSLGKYSIQVDATYSDPITVVLGSDYK